MLKLIRGTGRDAPETRPRDEDPLRPLVAEVTARGAGHGRAAHRLISAVGPAMLRVVRRTLGAAHPDVEDVFQESVMGLVQALPDFRGESSVAHFACRVAALTALASRRRQAVRDRHGSNVSPEEAATTSDAATSDAAAAATRRQLLRTLLRELPAVQAEALVLHCVAGLTVPEVADATAVPIETARSRLRLAKAALRARIGQGPLAAVLGDEP